MPAHNFLPNQEFHGKIDIVEVDNNSGLESVSELMRDIISHLEDTNSPIMLRFVEDLDHD